MTLTQPLLGEIFSRQIRLRIPVFQRHYVWNEQGQWQPLWDDFLNKLNEHLSGRVFHHHYTGSLVVYKEDTPMSSATVYSIIDGQQRLTTFQLFIAAFREACRKNECDEDLIAELNKLLFNDKSYGDKDYEKQKFKLEPTKFNKEDFIAIVTSDYQQIEREQVEVFRQEQGVGEKTYRQVAKNRKRILAAYLFFFEQFDRLISESGSDKEEFLKHCLSVIKHSFQFVEILLSKEDDPQVIFETMNGRGMPLTQTDLIRNFIFMRGSKQPESIDRIYEAYWDEFDDPNATFKWHDKVSRGRIYEARFQFFMVDYLTIKLLTDIRYDQVFYHYKSFILNDKPFSNIEEELKELNRFSAIYKRLTQPEGTSAFTRLAKRLADFDITTIYPLVMAIEGRTDIGVLDKNEMYQMLDSFITRRYLCGLTSKNYNNLFLDLLKSVSELSDAKSLREILVTKTADTNRWPTDAELQESMINRPIYREVGKTRPFCNLLLEVEHHLRGAKQEIVEFKNLNLTVEHVMPQGWWEHWAMDDEMIPYDDFEKAPNAALVEEDINGRFHRISNRSRTLHTVGNLTLLTNSLNPSVSNGPYTFKKQEMAAQSTLLLNAYFQNIPSWDETSIGARAQYLFEKAKDIWKYG